MGRARRKAGRSARSWPTSTSTTCSTCGSGAGGKRRAETWSWFGLELHPDKTRLIRFGRTAGRDGGEKPPTFNFLGFTHSCGKTRKGYFTVLRQTTRQRWQAKLSEVKTELRRRLHSPIPELGAYLASVVRGHVRYYGVPMNGPAIGAFRTRWLPPVHICHPYPFARFAVTTQGKSRMR